MADVDISVIDAAAVAEDFPLGFESFMSVVDTVGVAEALPVDLNSFVSVVDTVTIAEAITAAMGDIVIVGAEVIGLAESLSMGSDNFVSVIETVTLVENWAKFIPFDAIATEGSKVLSGDFEFTAVLCPRRFKDDSGYFSISVTGTWAGDLSLLRSLDYGATWGVYKVYTANAEEIILDPTWKAYYKAGFLESGDYTSGDAKVTLAV